MSMAPPPSNPPPEGFPLNRVDARILNIERNPDRFYLHISNFLLDLINGPQFDVFSEVIDMIFENLHDTAISTMKDIIIDYPGTHEAILSIYYLPYLFQLARLDQNDLVYYLRNMDYINHQGIVLESLALSYMFFG